MTWANSHRESLEAMRLFMDCGYLKAHGHKDRVPRYKQMYNLVISRRADMLRVANAMLPYAIVKRDKLLSLLETLAQMRDASPGRGNLAAAGAEEIRRLYWEEQMADWDIGLRFGVTREAVKQYMRRHGIPRRVRKAAMRMAASKRPPLDPIVQAERNAKISAAKKAHWQDPEYRGLALVRIRAAQPKRLADMRAKRALEQTIPD
jgi:hypothetical protein